MFTGAGAPAGFRRGLPRDGSRARLRAQIPNPYPQSRVAGYAAGPARRIPPSTYVVAGENFSSPSLSSDHNDGPDGGLRPRCSPRRPTSTRRQLLQFPRLLLLLQPRRRPRSPLHRWTPPLPRHPLMLLPRPPSHPDHTSHPVVLNGLVLSAPHLQLYSYYFQARRGFMFLLN